MTAMMIGDGKRIPAGRARLQWHMTPIADIDLIARDTAGKWGRVIAWRTLKGSAFARGYGATSESSHRRRKKTHSDDGFGCYRQFVTPNMERARY